MIQFIDKGPRDRLRERRNTFVEVTAELDSVTSLFALEALDVAFTFVLLIATFAEPSLRVCVMACYNLVPGPSV